MTTAQLIWSVLILAQAVLALVFIFHPSLPRRNPMAVLPQFVAPLAELEAAIVATSQSVTDLKASAANAPSAQDIADTLKALQDQADAAKALSEAAAPQVVEPPVIS